MRLGCVSWNQVRNADCRLRPVYVTCTSRVRRVPYGVVRRRTTLIGILKSLFFLAFRPETYFFGNPNGRTQSKSQHQKNVSSSTTSVSASHDHDHADAEFSSSRHIPPPDKECVAVFASTPAPAAAAVCVRVCVRVCISGRCVARCVATSYGRRVCICGRIGRIGAGIWHDACICRRPRV